MFTKPLVSAIITTHNRKPEILKRAIDSVLSQSYSPVELIVVDDSPGYALHNEIVELVNSYIGKLTYIVNTKPGACASRNVGIKAAQGKYVGLLDDDDEWLPNKLDILLPLFKDNIGLVYGSIKTISNGVSKNRVIEREKYGGNIVEKLFMCGNFIGGCSVPIFLKECIVAAGYFDESLVSAQDFDAWVRIAQRCEVAFTEDVVVKYYISGDAITSMSSNRINGRKQILNKYIREFDKYPAAKRGTVRDIIYYIVADGDYKGAFQFRKNYAEIIPSSLFVKMLIKGTLKRILIQLRIQNR